MVLEPSKESGGSIKGEESYDAGLIEDSMVTLWQLVTQMSTHELEACTVWIFQTKV